MADPIRQMAAASLFPTEGELHVDGLTAPVQVQRDEYGVPTIEAQTMNDLWFAQGLVTAGERLFQLELLLRAATGRLSEVFGERTFDDDLFARTVGLNRAGTRQAADYWNDTDHALHARFRAGILAWIDHMPAKPVEYQLLDIEPDIPDDPAPFAAAFAFVAWNLSNDWEAELLRAELDQRLGRALTDVLLPTGSGSGGKGSNNWVVAGSHTASGKPLLANDPHLLVTQPSVWLELSLQAPGYAARGAAWPFTPGIVIGATPHHAWGVTNVTGDVQDLYEERLNTDGTAARFGDAWEPLVEHDERIAVRGEAAPRTATVRETRHGPILTHGVAGLLETRYRPIERPYALRWVGHDATIRPSIALDLVRARDFDSFRRAALQVDCSGQNFVYADTEGHIGYQCTGRYPVRASGDGTRPVPGWNGEHEWVGWIAPEELPWEMDPDAGWIATANDDIHPEGYPHLIAANFHEPNRRERIAELLTARDDHDAGSMLRIQTDTVSRAAAKVLPGLLKLEAHTDAQRAAIVMLESWDGDLRADSHTAALYEAWISAIMRRLFADRMGAELFAAYQGFREDFACRALPSLLEHGTDRLDPDALRAALDDAIDETDGKTWGDLHTLVLAHPLARIPGLEEPFTAASIPLGGDDQTVAAAGTDGLLGYRPAVIQSMLAVFDMADPERNSIVLPTGVSGNPASPHWNDQTELYARGDAKRPATPAPARLSLVPTR
jgi:penicillin amidase